MAIRKKYLRRRPVCQVTFEVATQTAEQVCVVGDFNHWRPEGSRLQKIREGCFRGIFEFPRENSYEFRYLIDSDFVNETQADGFRWNAFAQTENSVLDT